MADSISPPDSISNTKTMADATPSVTPADKLADVATPLPVPKANSTPSEKTMDEKTTEARITRRIDLRLVPILSALYLLCFLCRQNIANAKTYGLLEELELSPKQYALALTVFFFTYSLFDIPANMLLKKLRPSVWLPSITLLSGAVTVGMGMTTNWAGLLGTRLLLGMTECGLFPGVAYCITLWYPKQHAQFRQALFFCAASMAGAFAGLLAVPLHMMDGIGGLPGFRWIFIIEGLLTVLVAGSAYFLVLDSPQTATFLTPSEKALLLQTLSDDEFGSDSGLLTAADLAAVRVPVSRKTALLAVAKDYRIYLHILVFLGISAPLYSISLCLPSIIQPLGYTATTANFLTVPIYITACLLSLLTAFFADRINKRFPPLISAYAVMFVGFLIALVRPEGMPALAYAGVFIAACGIYPAFPGMITWCSNNLASSGKRSVGMAMHIGFGSFGGAMGPNFYPYADAPGFRMGHAVNLGFVVMGACAAGVLRWVYGVENKRRAEERGRRREALEELCRGVGREEEKGLRRTWQMEKERSLVVEGDASVWFTYMV